MWGLCFKTSLPSLIATFFHYKCSGPESHVAPVEPGFPQLPTSLQCGSFFNSKPNTQL